MQVFLVDTEARAVSDIAIEIKYLPWFWSLSNFLVYIFHLCYHCNLSRLLVMCLQYPGVSIENVITVPHDLLLCKCSFLYFKSSLIFSTYFSLLKLIHFVQYNIISQPNIIHFCISMLYGRRQDWRTIFCRSAQKEVPVIV